MTGLGLGLPLRSISTLSLLLDSDRVGEPRQTELASGDPGPDPDPDPDPDLDRDLDLDLELDNERNPRSLSTSRSRSGDVPENESRLRCFASTGSMLRRMDGVPVLVLVPIPVPAPVPLGGVLQRLGLGMGLGQGVGGVEGAGVSFAVIEDDADPDAEVVKRESLDSPRGIVPVLVSVRAWLCSCSCPSCECALDSDADADTDIVIDMEESTCSRNSVSCAHVFPHRGL